ncbi:MAG: aspartate 1-decarboxylase [Actinobacteria bacterium]|nr:aspartate 1-decarboxylase [Actinomycetota bacterium]
MLINILKSKIHRALVTDAQLHYTGSITIDRELMDRAKLKPFEKVLVVSLDSGERLETYVIEGKRGSREICLNGAAARKIIKGDRIIIMAFAIMDELEAKSCKPAIIHLNDENKIIKEENLSEKDDEC